MDLKTRLIFFGVILSSLVFLNTFWFFSHESLRGVENENNQLTVVTIATGGYSPNLLIDSLYEDGQWRNAVVIADDCIENIVKPGYGRISRVPRPASVMETKTLKAKAFEHVSSQRVLFMDSDIVVKKPLKIFIQKIPKWKKGCDLYMQIYPLLPLLPRRFSFSTTLTPLVRKFDPAFWEWNSGIILMDRTHSAKLLEEWGKLIESGDFRMDQLALQHLLKSNKNFHLCALPEECLFPASIAGKVGQRLSLSSPTFIHMTSYNKAKYKARCDNPQD
mmetsp:Transcript_9594/g.12449  ORF Transcript_9594/g.12449 Transcript_9594/m.12449 type:complete len:276 (-) Transcript_9594:556-1383(-)